MISSNTLIIGISCWLFLSANALAVSNNADEQVNAKLITKAIAVQHAKQAIEGRVLKVDAHSDVFQVKILKETGRVVIVKIDRRTGEIMTKPNTKIKRNQ